MKKKLLFIFIPILSYSQSKKDQIETLKYYLTGENTFEKKSLEINYNNSMDSFYINMNSKMPPTNTVYVYNTSCRFKTSDINEIGSYYKDKILIMDILLSGDKCEHTSVKNNLAPEVKVNYLLNFSVTDLSVEEKYNFEDSVSKLFNKSITKKN